MKRGRLAFPKAERFWVGDGGIYTHHSWCHALPLSLEQVPVGTSPEPSTQASPDAPLCLNDYLLNLNHIWSLQAPGIAKASRCATSSKESMAILRIKR